MPGPVMRSRPWLGVTLIVGTTLCFAAMDNTVRYTGRIVPVLVIIWLRYMTQAVVMGAWLLHEGRGAFRLAEEQSRLTFTR